MKTLKSIDGKSLLIGGLLASTIFFAMGATSPTDKWDDKQEWVIASRSDILALGFLEPVELTGPNGRSETFRKATGWEPFGNHTIYRKRIK